MGYDLKRLSWRDRMEYVKTSQKIAQLPEGEPDFYERFDALMLQMQGIIGRLIVEVEPDWITPAAPKDIDFTSAEGVGYLRAEIVAEISNAITDTNKAAKN